MSVKKSLELTIQLLESILPVIDELLEYLEEHKGWLDLQPEVAENIVAWDLPLWSTFYLDKNKFKILGMLFLYDVEELKSVTPESAAEFNEKAKLQAMELFGEIDDVELPETGEIAALLEAAEVSEQEQITKQMLIRLFAFFTSTFHYLSLMTHGKTLCHLIALAQGDSVEADKCLCQAIQIDRTILQLPFVQNRILKAQLGNDGYFLEQLGNHIKRPILSGKIRYRKLWLTFAILEDEGFLNIPQEELLDLLNELGVYGKEFGVEDVGHLNQRLSDYRKKSSLGKKIF